MADRLSERAGNILPTSDETPFYIPATDAPARQRRTLKKNDTFAVFDSHGDIGASTGGQDGLFHCDTRYLSHLELLINGSRPLLLHSAMRDDNLNYYVDLTNPDFYIDRKLVMQKDTVHISRTIYLKDGSLRERIALTNHGSESVRFSLSMLFGSDFADIFEVRGMKRERRGTSSVEVDQAPVDQTPLVHLRYQGLDLVFRTTTLHFEPTPTLLQDSTARYDIELDPHAKMAIFATVTSGVRMPGTTETFLRGLTRLHRAQQLSMRGTASVETSNSVVNEILCRSMADVQMLMTDTEDGPYPYAGIPWYSTTFGRDGIITAMNMLWANPGIAAGVLRRLARLQAIQLDPLTDAAPGKIVHEMRGGEMAAIGEVPFRQYYGTVDATPLFVILAGRYAERTADWALVRQLWPSIEAALSWIDSYGDMDGDGFIEYARGTETGLANQGWKDSHDSISHADGRLASGPIALVEEQAYVFAARQAGAMCARRLGLTDRAKVLESQADTLRRQFEEAFWCPDLGFYGLALDGEKRLCRVRSSNAGHALFCGIVAPDRAKASVAALMRSDFFSGWGIRTLAQGEDRYNPMSYHNGSIWPHDNAILAAGFARYGDKGAAAAIFDAAMRAAAYMDDRRIPELYCGFRRRRGRGPVLYPAACAPQAWSASAPFSMLESLLGLEFRPETGELRLNNPVVPPSLDAIRLRNVRLGGGVADFIVRNSSATPTLEVIRTEGEIRISVVFGQDGL
jgi:glycogen debranching enzyme